jgi:hypothetical protein
MDDVMGGTGILISREDSPACGGFYCRAGFLQARPRARMEIALPRAVVKKVVFDEVQCSPHEFHNPVLDVCET